MQQAVPVAAVTRLLGDLLGPIPLQSLIETGTANLQFPKHSRPKDEFTKAFDAHHKQNMGPFSV